MLLEALTRLDDGDDDLEKEKKKKRKEKEKKEYLNWSASSSASSSPDSVGINSLNHRKERSAPAPEVSADAESSSSSSSSPPPSKHLLIDVHHQLALLYTLTNRSAEVGNKLKKRFLCLKKFTAHYFFISFLGFRLHLPSPVSVFKTGKAASHKICHQKEPRFFTSPLLS